MIATNEVPISTIFPNPSSIFFSDAGSRWSSPPSRDDHAILHTYLILSLSKSVIFYLFPCAYVFLQRQESQLLCLFSVFLLPECCSCYLCLATAICACTSASPPATSFPVSVFALIPPQSPIVSRLRLHHCPVTASPQVEDIPKRMGMCLQVVDNCMLSLYFSD
ncbi:PREDICTED: uncharacterized protein LOC109179768 [Ipomoea nil]|uniref:uncharacterized protein LOC109179768 n=1 Tax=Ipomoea nil TaxID=35883 RepID=UPI0009019978|nr:PREDICTED: uncharacterized protein LOC109179768 [Ipomoea nil]